MFSADAELRRRIRSDMTSPQDYFDRRWREIKPKTREKLATYQTIADEYNKQYVQKAYAEIDNKSSKEVAKYAHESESFVNDAFSQGESPAKIAAAIGGLTDNSTNRRLFEGLDSLHVQQATEAIQDREISAKRRQTIRAEIQTLVRQLAEACKKTKGSGLTLWWE